MSSSTTAATIDGSPIYEDVEQGGNYVGMAATGRAELAHLAIPRTSPTT